VANLLIGNARNVDVDYPAFRSGVQRFDYNLYDVSPQSMSFVVNRDSDSPAPWSNDEFRELILKDIGLTGNQTLLLQPSGKVAMTFSQWKQFWKTHGELNDARSQCDTGNSVSYEPSRYELSIALHSDPPEIRDAADSDKDSILGHLKRGAHKFTIWDGLPIVGADQLPPADWTK
jgi:hypothetical protein